VLFDFVVLDLPLVSSAKQLAGENVSEMFCASWEVKH